MCSRAWTVEQEESARVVSASPTKTPLLRPLPPTPASESQCGFVSKVGGERKEMQLCERAGAARVSGLRICPRLNNGLLSMCEKRGWPSVKKQVQPDFQLQSIRCGFCPTGAARFWASVDPTCGCWVKLQGVGQTFG